MKPKYKIGDTLFTIAIDSKKEPLHIIIVIVKEIIIGDKYIKYVDDRNGTFKEDSLCKKPQFIKQFNEIF